MENTETLNYYDADAKTSNNTSQPSDTINLNFNKIFEWVMYVFGFALIILSLIYFFNDLDTRSLAGQYDFKQESYVGGDAYNFIISAARSGAVMTKSLIMAVFGCSAIIIGRLTALINKK